MKLFALVFLFVGLFAEAQNWQLPLNNDIQYQIESNTEPKEDFHSSIKPYYKSTVPNIGLLGSDKQGFFKRLAEKKVGGFKVYPILDYTATLSSKTKKNYTDYYYGIGARLSIASKYTAGINFFTGEYANLPWVDSTVKLNHVIPGIGIANGTQLGYAATYLDFYVNYKPSEYFLLEAGKGKTFIGDGYRSLLLSDNVAPYPYLKLLTKVWKFNYLCLWNVMQHYDYLKQKTQYSLMAAHYLSFKPNKYFTLAFFEAEVYANRDTSGKTIRPEFTYFNPVVFYRPIEYSLGSSDNAMMGFNIKFQANEHHQFYTQVAIDELNVALLRAKRGWWGNKQAFQGGYKWFNMFNIKGLGLQLEGNYIRPYTYSHALTLQNYSHLNQPLTHPLGANLIEGISAIRYQNKAWMIELFINKIIYGTDTGKVNYGGDIFKSYLLNRPGDFGNTTAQGLKTDRTNLTLRASYYILPKAYLSLDAGVVIRSNKNAFNTYSFSGVFIGIKTRLVNSYTNY